MRMTTASHSATCLVTMLRQVSLYLPMPRSSLSISAWELADAHPWERLRRRHSCTFNPKHKIQTLEKNRNSTALPTSLFVSGNIIAWANLTDTKIKLEPFFPLLLRNLPIHSIFFTKDKYPKNYFFGRGGCSEQSICVVILFKFLHTLAPAAGLFNQEKKKNGDRELEGKAHAWRFFLYSVSVRVLCATPNWLTTEIFTRGSLSRIYRPTATHALLSYSHINPQQLFLKSIGLVGWSCCQA